MSVAPLHRNETGYPDERAHRQQWRDLVREIAGRADTIDDDPNKIAPPETPGELVVLGSGIEAVGFTSSDEMRIREADYVFYCVADPATKVWINTQRPDAYDLYVLYDDSKKRYLTYMQMTEAMLHYVRKGKKVAAIFYGHPGIFVLSTHRAIRIASREGHRAEMRAGVSALDVLCADLSVDPSQPGMAMYEATDMLIRKRRPDTGLHLVLWQVGLIGELGYRRQGYINSNFSVLLDYLEELYGDPDHEVVNYVGSRYPGVDPLIDRQTIASLRNPSARHWVTGISTFYLPPKDVAPSDPEMLERLGLIKPGQSVRNPTSPLRVIDEYGPRERAALSDFADFDIPATYQWQQDTGAARFILALREDGALRDQYHTDPNGAVGSWNGALSDRERRMLAQRDAGAMQIAAKGLRTRHHSENRRLLNHLLHCKSATRSLRRAVDRRGSAPTHQVAERWGESEGFNADWENLAGDSELLLRQNLHPWTGLYLIKNRQMSLSIHAHSGRTRSDRVELNGERLHGVQFGKGILSWTAEAGNSCSGYLQADLTPRGSRRFVGVLWPEGDLPSSEHKVVAIEHISRTRLPLSSIVGTYLHSGSDGIKRIVAIGPHAADDGPRRIQVTIDGQVTDDDITVGLDRFEVGDTSVALSSRMDDVWPPPHLQGEYRVRTTLRAEAEILTIRLARDVLEIEGKPVGRVFRNGSAICWEDGPAALASGKLTGLIDPITLHPMVFGEATSTNGTKRVLRGMVPVTDAEVVAAAGEPADGLPPWAWEHVYEIMATTSTKGGIFLWHGWERTALNLRRIRHVLTVLRQD